MVVVAVIGALVVVLVAVVSLVARRRSTSYVVGGGDDELAQLQALEQSAATGTTTDFSAMPPELQDVAQRAFAAMADGKLDASEMSDLRTAASGLNLSHTTASGQPIVISTQQVSVDGRTYTAVDQIPDPAVRQQVEEALRNLGNPGNQLVTPPPVAAPPAAAPPPPAAPPPA